MNAYLSVQIALWLALLAVFAWSLFQQRHDKFAGEILDSWIPPALACLAAAGMLGWTAVLITG